MTDEVLTIREIAAALRLAEKTVYAMAVARELPAFKIRGQWRVRRSDFQAWLSAHAGSISDSPEQVGSTTTSPTKSDQLELVSGPRPISDLTERISQSELHRRLVAAIGSSNVRDHSDLDVKPFEMDLSPPMPQRVRVYMYNATRPPGGRPLGEHKVQLIVPGQRRDQRGSFDHSDGRIVLLVGYSAEEEVFILWDAGLYTDFAWSRNVQVKAETIIQASAGKIATQERQLRPASGKSVIETLVATKARGLADALVRRMELTRARLLKD
ncbi:MAG: helix-turn-helix domain-containing protein [Steroidobacteraceae bacterium]|nr:helix-turn-helix domain-containing protein [Fimbriimonadaceae bacterium]